MPNQAPSYTILTELTARAFEETVATPRLILSLVMAREEVRRPALEMLRRMPLWPLVEPALAQPVAYPPLTDDMKHRLAEYYADDVSHLSTLIGRDLSCWLKRTPAKRSRPSGPRR